MKRLFTLLAIVISFSSLAQTFTSLNGPFGGSVLQFEYDATNSKTYALVGLVGAVGAGNTLFSSTDNGATWTELPRPADQPNWGPYSFTLDGSKLMITDLFNQVQTSTDGGVTWTVVGVIPFADNMKILKKLPTPGGFVAAGVKGVQLTLDGGATWKTLLSYPQPGVTFNIDLDVSTGGDIYYSYPLTGILKFKYPANPTDLNSWVPANWITVMPRDAAISTDVALKTTILTSGKVLISHTLSSFLVSVALSSNGETGWVEQTLPGLINGSDITLVSSPSGKAYFYANPNPTFTSWEFTEPSTWTTKPWPTDAIGTEGINCVFWRTATQALAGGVTSGVFATINAGTSWSSSSTGMKRGQGAQVEVMLDGKIIQLQGDIPKAYWYSTDNGVTWQINNLNAFLNKLFRIDGTTLLMTSEGSNLISTDGINWTTITNPGSIGRFEDIYVFSSNDIYGIGTDGTVWESINKGTSWTQISLTVPLTGFQASKLTRDTDGIFYAFGYTLSGPKFWKLDSNTIPWTATQIGQTTFANSPFTTDKGAPVIFSLNNKLYVQELTRGLYSSSDKGATFNFVTSIPTFGYAVPLTQGTLKGLAYFNQNGFISVTQDEGKTLVNIPLPEGSAKARSISLNAAGDKFFVAAKNSPTLLFTVSSTNKLLLPPAEQTPYIDFAWQRTASGPMGSGIVKVLKNSTGELFGIGSTHFYHYNTTTSAWDDLQGGVVDAFIDPSNKIYLLGKTYSTNATIYTSTNNGATFTTQVSDVSGSVVSSILVNDIGSIFVTSATGLYRSTNGGATFTQVDGGSYSKLAMSSANTLFALKDNGGGLFRSTDKGLNWSLAQTGITFLPGETVLAFAAMDAGHVAASTRYSVFVSTNEGASWTEKSTGFDRNDFDATTQRMLNVGSTGDYWLTLTESNTVIYTSSNQGTTWTRKGAYSPVLSSLLWKGTDIYASSPTNPYKAPSGVLKSTDNGTTFAPFQPKGLTDNVPVAMEIFGRNLFAVVNKGLYVSSDKGQTTTAVASVDAPVNGLVKSPDGSLIAFGDAMFKTTDGVTWTKMANPGNVQIRFLATGDGLTFYGFTGSGVVSSTDLTTWTPVNLSVLQFPYEFYSMSVSANGVLYFVARIGTSTPSVYQYAAGSVNKLSFTRYARNTITANGKIYICDSDNSGSTIYSSTNGLTWTAKPGPPGDKLFISSLNYFFIRDFHSGILYLSRDQGTTWQNVSYGDPNSDLLTPSFSAIALDEFSGLAFGGIDGLPIMKSAGIVIPTDTTVPVITGLKPVNTATGVLPTATLSITFDQATTTVAGKKLKIVDAANGASFVESLDASAGVPFDRTFTFTPAATTLKYSPFTGPKQVYYITIESGAFVDLFGNPNGPVLDNTTWKFEMAVQPDVTKPTITFTPSAANNLANGDPSKTITVNMTDNIGVTVAKAYYRKITNNDPFPAGKVITETTPGSGTYNFIPTSSEFGALGLEYYFEAQDAAGNKTISPADGTYYRSYINFPDGKKPTISPALPAGKVTADYRIIAVPYTFTSATANDVLVPSLGAYDNTVWRLLTLNAGATDWTELNGTSTLEVGRGYWLIYKPGGSPALAVSSTPAVTKENPTSITLSPGWNQIGNPYPFDIDWAQVLAANPAVPTGATGVLTTLKSFVGGADFTSVTSLKATQGGFAHNGSSSAITLKIPVVVTGTGGRRVEPSSRLDEANWKLPIALKNGTNTTNLGAIGMNPDASNGVDAFDDLNPPVFQDYLRIDFPHPESRVKKLGVDIVQQQNDYTWHFTVSTNQSGTTELMWDNSGFGPGSRELFLFDIALQKPVNMREATRYSFDPSVSKDFRIYYGEQLEKKIMPDFVQLGDAYPNPSTGVSIIPFTLPDQGTSYGVKVEVYDMLGQLVATLQDGTLPSGFYNIAWNGSQQNPGMYVYRLMVAGPGGQFVQNKRIVLQK
ncbi:MAG TPA: T9SS type A sorting domain-containing protein [Cyclobacteriaceae bacterium]|nr:T9SS type A sorting domain-containing protein [Cyclobacteriaceae bacterium]